jgi:flagellar hook assembly protein FlgD
LANVSSTISNSNENISYEQLLGTVLANLETDLSTKVPTTLGLEQNYPNPFNPVTTIKFNLQKNTKVTLKIYNSLGQEVLELASKSYSAGTHEVKWNAEGFASGIYFMQLVTNEFSQSKKMILLK